MIIKIQEGATSQPTPAPRRFRMQLRELIILVISLGCGIGAEQLVSNASVPFGQAVVAGAAAFAGVFYFLDRTID